MSEMSQASAPAGGDPLDLTPDTTGSDEATGSDPSPEGGATLDPPDTTVDAPDEASGVDPLQGGGVGGDLESGADPMPDIAGTS